MAPLNPTLQKNMPSSNGNPRHEHQPRWRHIGCSLSSMKFVPAQFARRLSFGVLALLPTILAAEEAGPDYHPAPARLMNMGVRGTLAADETLIAGFYISEGTGATLLVRAAGPALTAFGISGAMANPKLQLFDSAGHLVAANDDWSAETPASTPGALAWSVQQAAQMAGAFPYATASRDAAIAITLKPGAYTLVISGSTSGDTGVVLGEIYHLPALETVETLSAPASKPRSQVSNLSVRGRIAGSANNDGVMIGSFVVGGSTALGGTVPSGNGGGEQPPTKRFLIRIVGPGLAPFGMTDAVPDPTLELKGTNGVAIQMNDNWDADFETGKTIRETSEAVGAFPLAPGSRDAAVIARLAEGAYNVIARGANGATGTVLIEIYELAD
jgi:hypothetical protein